MSTLQKLSSTCRFGFSQICHKRNGAGLFYTLGRCMSSTFNPDEIMSTPIPDVTTSYTERDGILYALGVGTCLEQNGSMRYLYERSKNFSILPTFGTLSSFAGFMHLTDKFLDISKILHGEHYIEQTKPLPRSASLTQKCRIVDILDKGKGTLLLVESGTFDKAGEQIFKNLSTIYTSQYHGWGGKKNSDKDIKCVPPPDRQPDISVKQKTSRDQAVLYRLSGDTNPLHIDPAVAKRGGFDTPILHGLCTYGHSVRHVLQSFCDGDPSAFKASKLRFSKPVIPGQTIQTDMWKDGSRIFFQTKVAETDSVCISGAYVDLVN